MRRITHVRNLILFLAALPLFAAGTVTSTLTKLSNTETYVITVTATADASDGSYPTHVLPKSGTGIANTDGYSIVHVETDPGSTAPTDDWDLYITNDVGLDLMAAECENRDTSATERCSANPAPLNGPTTLVITGNSVNSATITIRIYLVRQTVAKRGDGSAGGGGSGATSLDGLSDVAVGTTPPGTCTDDSLYLDTSEAIPAERLKICESNTWYKVAELTAGDYIDITGRTISLSTSVPIFSSGASDPSGACETREIYLQTTTKDWWGCEGTSTWRRLTGSVFALVDTGGDDTYGNSTACAGFPATYVDGQVVILQATTANTGAATLDCRPGAKAIKLLDGTTNPNDSAIEPFKPTILQYKSSADGGSGAWILLVPGSSSSGGGDVLVFFWATSGMTQNLTRYATPGDTIGNATESNRQMPMPRAGTMSKLYVRTLSNIGGSGDTWVTTIRKNGADTALTCTISTGASSCNDTSNSVSFAAGDLYSIKIVSSATTGTHYPYVIVSYE